MSPFVSKAQLTLVGPAMPTALDMVTKLTGAGVTVLNPTLTCPNNARRFFQGNGLPNMAFDSGIIMSSGNAAQAIQGAGTFASAGNGAPGDPQLTTLAGQTTYDACVLQFDFRPSGDTIKFDYVFGSEEYPGFTCTTYNDVFAFFVSGPGIVGSRNIALVPGTNIPVCINSVNCGPTGAGTLATCQGLGPGSPFCTYYINNSTGNRVVYDGLTKTLTAIQPVTPCDTYHLKIGIADAFDDIYDSGVFLKAGSLRSKTFTSDVVGTNPSDTGYSSQYIVRGCTPGYFVFQNTGSLLDSINVRYIIGGTGINGVDYNWIPDSTTIQVGHATDTVFIYGSTTVSGVRTVVLYILAPFSCNATGPTIIDSVSLTILDSFRVQIATPDTTVCIGQSVQITTIGASDLTYVWTPVTGVSNPNIQNPIITPPLGATTYMVSAGKPGCPPARDFITVTAVAPPPPPVVTSPNYCTGAVPGPFNVTTLPGGIVTWYLNATMTGGSTTMPTINTSVPGILTFYFNQRLGSCESPVDSVKVTIFPGTVAAITPDIDRGCFGDFVTFSSAGTVNANTYAWDFGDGAPVATNANVSHVYSRANGIGGTFTVVLKTTSLDNCVDTAQVEIDTRHSVVADFTIPDNIICAKNPAESASFINNSTADVHTFLYAPPSGTPNAIAITSLTHEWTFGDGSPMDGSVTPADHPYPVADSYLVTLIVTDTIGCKDTAVRKVISQEVTIHSFTDSTLCLRQPMYIDNYVTSFPLAAPESDYTYHWTELSDGSGPVLSDVEVQHPYLTGFGTYVGELEVTHVGGGWACKDQHTITVHSVEGARLQNVTLTTTIMYGNTIQLNAENEMYYHWVPEDGSVSNPNISNPIAAPQQSTTYTVYGMDKYGCVDSSTFTIIVDSSLNEGIPTAFTPNGDGLNDVFRPVGINYQRLVEFRVYNRLGQEVFYTREAGKGWDGTFQGQPQDLGVYHYQVIVNHPDGTSRKYKGDVTLIR